MDFVAEIMSADIVDGVTVLALGSSSSKGDSNQPDFFVILSGGDEDDQDLRLGLTGVHIETSRNGETGYGLVEQLELQGDHLTIKGRKGFQDIRIDVHPLQIDQAKLMKWVTSLNAINSDRP